MTENDKKRPKVDRISTRILETHETPKVLDTESDSSSDSSFVEVSEIMNRGKLLMGWFRLVPKVASSNLTNTCLFKRSIVSLKRSVKRSVAWIRNCTGRQRSWVRSFTLSYILQRIHIFNERLF